jgi:hypothetical protein
MTAGMGRSMAEDEIRWVVRLRPVSGQEIQDLLELPLSIDIWQRNADGLVAVVSSGALQELERRRLANVEKVCTTAEYLEWADKHAGDGQPGRK